MDIYFNIWDDYPEYGQTFGYFEEDEENEIPLDIKEQILKALSDFIFKKNPTYSYSLDFNSSHLILDDISYNQLDILVEELQTLKIQGLNFHVYSES